VPSYRITVTVGVLRPGVDPEAVLPAAASAARSLATVEAWDVAVVRGQARITVRFTVDDDAVASDVAAEVVGAVSGLAAATAPALTRRYGARWYPVGARTG
jgi:hypothetical protein